MIIDSVLSLHPQLRQVRSDFGFARARPFPWVCVWGLAGTRVAFGLPRVRLQASKRRGLVELLL